MTESAYRDLYRGSQGHAVRGEASVSTLYYHERSIPRLRAIASNPRIVILLREPVDRAHSGHQYMTARGFETLDFEAALAAERNRIDKHWHHQWHYVAMSRYAASVEAFVGAFGASHVGIWFFDDLQRDYPATVRQILKFLGAPSGPELGAAVPRVNVSGVPRSVLAHRAVARLTVSPVARASIKRVTPYRAREWVRRSMLRSAGVDPGLREHLKGQLAADTTRLAAFIRERYPHTEVPGWLR